MRQAYSELVQFRAPPGLVSAVSEAAAKEGLSVSAYIRRLAMLHLARAGAGERSADRRAAAA
jgi:predicted HicB family RNase H-like nuclease